MRRPGLPQRASACGGPAPRRVAGAIVLDQGEFGDPPARPLLIAGLGSFAVSTYWLRDVDANTAFAWILFCIVVSRVGQALVNPTLNATAMRSLQGSQLRRGAGMIDFFRQLGGAFGVTLFPVSLDRDTFFYSNRLASMAAGRSRAIVRRRAP